MAFHPGQLFRRADEVFRHEIEESFRRSPVGYAIKQLRARPGGDPSALLRRLEQGATLRELKGTTLRELMGLLERYAGGQRSRAIRNFLSSLGPVGTMLSSIFEPLSKSPFQAPGFRLSVLDAMNLLRAFGFEVLPPDVARLPREERQRAVWAAYYFLREHADMLLRRPEYGLAGMALQPAEEPTPEETGRTRPGPSAPGETVVVPMRLGGPREFPATHPIVTGEMVEVRSSNVQAIGYDVEHQILYVRFWAETTRQGQVVRFPGSLYGYRDVWPEEFLSFLNAASKGNWVWDHLRERGTVSGHKKAYFLAGITGGYVPRQAALTTIRGPKTGKSYLAEVFRPRSVFQDGKWLESRLPFEVVQVMKVVKPPRPEMRHLLGLN